MKLLVIEDEDKLGEYLRGGLTQEGFVVDLVRDGVDGLHQASEGAYDLVLLDGVLPGIDGLAVLAALRQQDHTPTLPVLMLTARAEVEDRVRGLQAGADDYLVKPFAFSELVARIQALLRRANPQLLTDVLKAGDLELDRTSHRVRRGGRELHLGPTEYRLLEYLMRHPGRVYSREQLLDGVWGNDVYVDERTVDVHVGRLRKAINRRASDADPIRTVRGAGYSFDERFAAMT